MPLLGHGGGRDHGSEQLAFTEDSVTGAEEVEMPEAKVWGGHLSAESPRIKAGMVLEERAGPCFMTVPDRASEPLAVVRIRQETCLS